MIDNYLNSLNTHDFAVASTFIYVMKEDLATNAMKDSLHNNLRDQPSYYDIVGKHLEIMENIYIPPILANHSMEEYVSESEKLYRYAKSITDTSKNNFTSNTKWKEK